ncbi:MAG: hypothetical protein RL139_1249, partial [Gemmatimonadota bacterium]
TLAALEATLALYRDPVRARREIPALAMLTADPAALRARADAVAEAVRRSRPEAAVAVEPSEATVGGGAFPTARLASWAVTVGGDVETIEARLRAGAVPVVARIAESRVRLDLRSVPPDDDASLAELLGQALA